MRLIIYLDDILIMNVDEHSTKSDVQLVIDLLHRFGFHINWEKSVRNPSQVMEYLGLRINSISLSFALPIKFDKAEKVKVMCEASMAETAKRKVAFL